MNSIGFFKGEKELGKFSWSNFNRSFEVNLTTVARWEHIRSRVVECGDEKELSFRREVGVQTSQSLDLVTTVKSSLKVNGFANFAADLQRKTSFELKVDNHYVEEEKYKITAPKCGTKKLCVYQLIKEHRFEIVDNRLFKIFGKDTQYFPITEYTDHIWDSSPTIHNSPECNCENEVPESEGILELNIRNLNVATTYRHIGDQMLLDSLGLTLSHSELAMLALGKCKLESSRLPDYQRFLAGFNDNEILTLSLQRIAPLGEQYDQEFELVDLANSIAANFSVTISEPQILGQKIRSRVLKSVDIIEDDSTTPDSSKLYLGSIDED